ncbi:DUF1844 domain-containing protein [Botrimarina hoheduenensis]|uniref:DUF1844 domain-containing protein n=1 Tax=Botrimarina hoheduenensis TaxID=2528000 RepID=A0A5C5W9R9_9BACT|nr:DUF1844 domain-containing protein [Botrimarina hoheduenensis]TWT47606.1 hypothetical protein Pla111_12210 [Botrimarina hoheduenensis]
MSEEKKIIIDEDWKSQVAAEKEAAQQQTTTSEPQTPATGQASASGTPADPPLPPASFGMLLSSLATEAMMAMGHFPHPLTGETTPHREQAKYLIDTIDMLRMKTKGNLSADESAAVEDVLHQLRMAFVTNPAPPQTPAGKFSAES